jgi:uroporphyrinogen-III decarboxylase
MAAELGRLAAVYGTKFPLEGDAPVRRINDREAASAATQIAEQADGFKNAVNREQTLAKPVKDALKGQADAVKNAAKTLTSRLKDAKPSTSEARQLFDAVRAMRESAQGVSPASLSLLGQMQAPLTTLSQAFGINPTSSGT